MNVDLNQSRCRRSPGAPTCAQLGTWPRAERAAEKGQEQSVIIPGPVQAVV